MCDREVFWETVKSQKTVWHIDARRAVLAAVERAREGEGVAAIQTWLNNADFQRFTLEYPRDLARRKNLAAKKAFEAKSDEEKLLVWADVLKQQLRAYLFCVYQFDKPRRTLKYCHVNGLVMLDIDHVENPMQVWYKLRDDEELMTKIALVHITSSKFGVRIVSVADINLGNLADNQIVLAEKLGQKPDESCIDATRNSFAPKEEDILYINEDLLFDYYDEDFDKRFTPEYRQKRTQPLYHEFPSKDEKGDRSRETGDRRQESGDRRNVQIKWRGYDLQGIIDARYAAKLPCADDSNRHKESLKLATDLLLMLDGDKAAVQKIVESQSWVQEIIAERDEDVAQTVESAAACVKEKEKKYASSLPSKAMLEAVKAFTGKAYLEITDSEKGKVNSEKFATANSQFSTLNSQLEQWGAEIQEMFDDFPMLRDVCSGLKRSQYPAALFVAGGTMMTLMTRCWYRFYHRPQQERRLNCSLYIIGHPASNKSMADDIYEILSLPIAAADKAGKAALNRYKQDLKKKAANKEGKDKPQGIIRIHPARTSNGQLIQDMLNAKETIEGKEIQLHLFTFDTELDNATTLQQGGSWINKQSMELKAFHNEKDGQMYQNSDSPVDEFNVTWNYIYTGTPIALKKKVNERNFGSGLSTRLAVIPMPKTNFEMMELEEMQTIDWQRLERMKTWAFKLDTRYGELPLWPLVVKLHGWTKNRMADCEEDQSEANELMLKRVAYHALNYATPFIDMRHWKSLHQQGSYWTGEYEVDETDWKLCELIARIQYATQQHFFGVLAEKYFDDMNSDVQISGRRHQQRSVQGYNRLPDVFTIKDVCDCFGYGRDNTAEVKIKRLRDASMIEKIESEGDVTRYRKIHKSIL